MKITASIVTYNCDIDELRRCVETLRANGVFRVFISDNSSSACVRDLCSGDSLVVYIDNGRNLGYGGGHNVAMRRALDLGCDYHLVSNSDVSFNNDVVSKIVDYMQQNPDVGLVNPCMHGTDGEMQYFVRFLPTPFDVFARRFLPRWLIGRHDDKYTLRIYDRSKPFNAPALSGAFMFFRAKALRDCGLFDERIFLYIEDYDLSRRIHRLYRTMYLPSVSIVHSYGAGAYHSFRLLLVHIKSVFTYFCKWGWFFDKERSVFNKRLLAELEQRSGHTS